MVSHLPAAATSPGGGRRIGMVDCPPLPAESATRVPVVEQRARVCVGGRAIVLGDRRVRKASAAGHRVAWIESHGDRVVIRVARVGRRVTQLRRIVRRVRGAEYFGVVLTRGGDLAWLASSYPRGGEVALARPGRAPRVLDRYTAVDLGLEDGRTLRWDDLTSYHSFFDLRQVPCPSRPRFAPLLQTERVLLTQRRYASTIVLRGCDLTTRRDVVIGEQESHVGNSGALDVIGTDGTWVLLRYSDTERYTGSGSVQIATADVATGDRKAPFPLANVAAPHAGAFAITDRGIPVWLAGDRLLTPGRRDVVEIDHGAIADIRSDGERVSWTNNGTPRSATPAW
jgi:hypothetical protein